MNEWRDQIAVFLGALELSSQSFLCYWPKSETELVSRMCDYVNSSEWSDRLLVTCPDFPNDLNAMHEAEKKLTGILDAIYDNCLLQICGSLKACHRATALQRAEAFVKTINWNKHGLGGES